MADQTYEVTLQRHLSLLSTVLIYHTVSLTAIFTHFGGLTTQLGIFVIYGFFFLWDALPTIICHWQYTLANRGARLIVRRHDRTLSYITKREKLDFSFDDIERIDYVMGYGNGAFYSSSQYRFYVLVFKDGKKILITSLLMSYEKKVEIEYLYGLQVKSIGRAFPWIKKKDWAV
jgi:hypothetical protein